EVVGEAVGLVFELVDVLLGAELEQHESPARVAVRRALELAPDGEDVRVRLHPDTCITPAELEELSPTGAVVVVADATVEPTGCVLEVGACRIDAQIGPALERVRAALENVRAHSRNELAP
ncbi:MAG TPA: FliH/SctL family protein, partial [Acidimicrobiales bacterium]|nr:FliH/SctL family protein [Acidimicrobiales bacterium]